MINNRLCQNKKGLQKASTTTPMKSNLHNNSTTSDNSSISSSEPSIESININKICNRGCPSGSLAKSKAESNNILKAANKKATIM